MMVWLLIFFCTVPLWSMQEQLIEDDFLLVSREEILPGCLRYAHLMQDQEYLGSCIIGPVIIKNCRFAQTISIQGPCYLDNVVTECPLTVRDASCCIMRHCTLEDAVTITTDCYTAQNCQFKSDFSSSILLAHKETLVTFKGCDLQKSLTLRGYSRIQLHQTATKNISLLPPLQCQQEIFSPQVYIDHNTTIYGNISCEGCQGILDLQGSRIIQGTCSSAVIVSFEDGEELY